MVKVWWEFFCGNYFDGTEKEKIRQKNRVTAKDKEEEAKECWNHDALKCEDRARIL